MNGEIVLQTFANSLKAKSAMNTTSVDSQAKATITPHLQTLLASRHPPKTFCPSEVARALSPADLHALGCKDWRAAMPLVRAVAWAMRDGGDLEVIQKGEVLGPDVGVEEVKGPVRIRRR
ncbi:hypothetical protein B0A50_01694 [Salinomyces thailandicus]|uniref:DUF3253 domain-containing protein n=1 Tax=Salinomyces thailandicus TaxID=706561 RepID=A0A4U0U973_9PEZI|nr:hypothetical protein B0A50_01694 [Salinomyces thailandica]